MYLWTKRQSVANSATDPKLGGNRGASGAEDPARAARGVKNLSAARQELPVVARLAGWAAAVCRHKPLK
jgi:hypothetical protein